MMSSDVKSPAAFPSSEGTPRKQTPSPLGLRHRPSLRSSANNIKDGGLAERRRSSFFSDSLSDTHRSFRTSTDDLLLPRLSDANLTFDDRIETSHWHSVPLGLALLPAVAGLFFKDGSAIITDVTLLGLAAIFLNWALRLPWEWYKAAQATISPHLEQSTSASPVDDEEEEKDDLNGGGTNFAPKDNGDIPEPNAGAYVETEDSESVAAQQELRLHQFMALMACFGGPLLGAWLLHAIRSQLSRPSEGLVSNYNLTIFLLVAEIRPLSHAIKLVQRRTLFLQRKVNSKGLHEEQIDVKNDLTGFARRLEELEGHVADNAANHSSDNTSNNVSPETLVAQAASKASTDLRKSFQPELDALNRAMRRYEKRMTITAIQVEARLQDLETRLKDVVVLAAAAQRNADKNPQNYRSILANWLCAVIVIPAQYSYRVISLPGRIAHVLLDRLESVLNLNRKSASSRDNKGAHRPSAPRTRVHQKKGKAVA